MNRTLTHGFILEWERNIPELKSLARLWRHKATGAQLLSLVNTDENKVFGASFKTPPRDSTGVAHILEHSVLCGSEKYPVKEPFVELLKGSLQTFLNAFTFPDKTCYPVASANLDDFGNLIDVYLDAVFHPNISEATFQQEGWHLEAEDADAPFSYKGVVYNEMKGVYSSPDSVLAEASQQALFPDTTYALDSGGDPRVIPGLTYEAFRAFHETYYHPSNARFFFWGDDPEDARLKKIDAALRGYAKKEVDATVALQPRFAAPREVERAYAASADEENPRAMLTVNWLLTPTTAIEEGIAFQILDHILTGLPGSPLRRALIESGLGEDITGGGLESDLRETFYSIGLKGVLPGDMDRAAALITETLASLVDTGIPDEAVEAAINSVEFSLREKNTGRFPVGLAVMIRALSTWLHDGDPLAPLAFEKPLGRIKERVRNGEQYFEGLIQEWFLDNPHRATVRLLPDKTLAARLASQEAEGLAALKARLDPAQTEGIVERAKALQASQAAPDTPEALATIPRLGVRNLPRENTRIPTRSHVTHAQPLLFHPLPTSGIAYTQAAFDLTPLIASRPDLVPLLPLFGRSLLEMGTRRRDFARLGMLIARKSGGIQADTLFLTGRTGGHPAMLVLDGKTTAENYGAFVDILEEILLEPALPDRERLRQMALEEKARLEEQLVPAGHTFVGLRLRAALDAASSLGEATGGIAYLDFIRALPGRIDADWDGVRADLEAIRSALIVRDGVTLNLTADPESFDPLRLELARLAEKLPQGGAETRPDAPPQYLAAHPLAAGEALIAPAQVNYVGKGANLYELGYAYHGSIHVIMKHLRMAWLWDKIRVQGGAYGAFCAFDRFSGTYTQVSYRDPNVEKTLAAYDGTPAYLRGLSLSRDDLEAAIVGAIGAVDAYLLPDARGATAFARHLTGDTDAARQKMREEILGTTLDHFRQFADVLEAAAAKGRVVMLGGSDVERYAAANSLAARKA